MDVDKLAEIVDEMIVQHDYPGFEPRALKLGLPESITKAPAKVFSQAFGHENVFVRLAALRWFQERPGMAKNTMKAVMGLYNDPDPFVRLEAVRLTERFLDPTKELAVCVSKLLEDEDPEVQRTAARACGKLCKKLKIKDETVIDSLKKAASSRDSMLRGKAEKALRVIGFYD
jgi:vesicle coat complex subunit